MLNKIISRILNIPGVRPVVDRCCGLWVRMFLLRIEKTHKNDWIFCVLAPIGDEVAFCGLLDEFQKRHGGKCVLLVRDAQRACLAKLFDGVDEVIKFPHGGFFDIAVTRILRNQQIERGHIIAPLMMNLDAPLKVCQGRGFLDEFKNILGMLDYHGKIKSICREISNGSIKSNVISIVPDAGSMILPVDKSFWIALAQKLVQLGYTPIFNAKPGSFDKFKCEFLDLKVIPAVAITYAAVIGVRCGLLDLFACGKPKCLVALYPFNIVHPKFGRAHLEWVRKTNPNSWDPSKSDDENFRSHFAMDKMFEDSASIHEIVIKDGSEDAMNKIIEFLDPIKAN